MKTLFLLPLLLVPADDPKAPETYKVKLETSKGDIVIKVTRDWAPKGADRLHALVKAGYYDECRFYRVLPKFIAQFGISGTPATSARSSRRTRAAASRSPRPGRTCGRPTSSST